MDMADLLTVATEQGASDVHVIPLSAPMVRVNGELSALSLMPVLTPDDTQNII